MKNTTTEILLAIRKKKINLFFSLLFAAILESKQKEEGNLQGITAPLRSLWTQVAEKSWKPLGMYLKGKEQTL